MLEGTESDWNWRKRYI